MEIKDQLRQFFSDNFLVEFGKDVSEEDSLLENGIIDSTGVLELVTFVEKTYKIKVNDDEIIPDNFDSIENIIKFVKQKQN